MKTYRVEYRLGEGDSLTTKFKTENLDLLWQKVLQAAFDNVSIVSVAVFEITEDEPSWFDEIPVHSFKFGAPFERV